MGAHLDLHLKLVFAPLVVVVFYTNAQVIAARRQVAVSNDVVRAHGLPVAIKALKLILYLQAQGIGIVEGHHVQRERVL